MKFRGIGLALRVAAMAGVLGMVAPAHAGFPDRPIKLVVPFTAGGPTDALARNLAEGLRQQLNQIVVIENKGGAGANIGAEFVANSPADGYTLLFGTSGPLAINTSLFKKLNYDPVNSFDPVIMIGKLPNVLSVHPSLPITNIKELVAYSKAGKTLSYSSSGMGSSTHLAGILFSSMTRSGSVARPLSQRRAGDDRPAGRSGSAELFGRVHIGATHKGGNASSDRCDDG
jgi:tripartite-type tricarboxylate transporter receptor subunit TctC